MPVFMVAVNGYNARGGIRPMPELIGVITSAVDEASAIALTLDDETLDVRDIDVEQLSAGDRCWFVVGGSLRH